MKTISLRLSGDLANGGESTFETSLLGMLYNVVGIAESAIIPPLPILNGRLLSGGNCNPFGNVHWQPFEITSAEYRELCDAAANTDPLAVMSYKGIRFVRLKRAEQLDHLHFEGQWSDAVRKEYSDGYVAQLIALNEQAGKTATPSNASPANENTTENLLGGEAAPTKPDLAEVRTVLKSLAAQSIRQFRDQSIRGTFYAFGFDLNAEYGAVLISANTEEAFLDRAQYYIDKYQYDDKQLAALKRNPGDWEYMGFNQDHDHWDNGWQIHQQAIDEFIFSDSTSDADKERLCANFIRMCSEVLLELDQEGYFLSFEKSEDFFLQCADHDEDEYEALERFERIKRAFMENL